MKNKLWSGFLPTKRGMFGHVWAYQRRARAYPGGHRLLVQSYGHLQLSRRQRNAVSACLPSRSRLPGARRASRGHQKSRRKRKVRGLFFFPTK